MKQVILEAHSGMAQSGARTERMHQAIIDYVKELIPNFNDKYEAKTEYKFKDAINKTGKMSIDIVIFLKETAKPVLAIPVKAPISNFGQNSGNIANGNISETIRIRRYSDCPLLFLTVLSNKVPYYKTDGFRGYENENYIDLTEFLEDIKDVYFSRVSFSAKTSESPTKDEYKNQVMTTMYDIDTVDFDSKIKSVLL